MTRIDTLKACLPMGLLCGAVGLAAGAWVAHTAIGEGYGGLVIAAPVAAAGSGMLFWWLFVVRRARQGRVLPALAAGVCAAVLANFLCWFLLVAATSPDRALAGPAALTYGAWSLYLLGWILVPVGASLGVVLAMTQRR